MTVEPAEEEGRQIVARRLRTQGRACDVLGSLLYASLLDRAALDVEEGGPLWGVLRGHESDPGPSALALRLLGAVHKLALEGRAPSVAAHFPSCGGDGDAARAWPALLELAGSRRAELRSMVERGVQTNEVGRSAALLGGFLLVAKDTGLPLRILEIGCSAGLNLRWDRFRYLAGSRAWGPSESPLVLDGCFVSEHLPPFEVSPEVAVRKGCDRSPIDATSADGQLTLLSYVWPDQLERMARLRAAFEVAMATPVGLEAADAPAWLRHELARPADGMATVIFHSVFMQYLSGDGRADVIETIRRAGAEASDRAPVAWLRMEPARPDFEVRLTRWPGGGEQLLATSGAHGQDVRWLADRT